MLKTLSAYIGEYKKDSIKTPIYIIFEVLMEILIPFVTASIIDKGIQAGDMKNVCIYGGIMLVLAFVSLFCGISAGKYAASASTGFACNLREGIYTNIQNFAFSNIDKYSTAGLITRMTTDVTNVQNAYQMLLRIAVRAPLMMICSMIMCFIINPTMSMIFLGALILLGFVLFFIIFKVTPIFTEGFAKYDDLNASVQENVSGIRVVKAFVREEYENDKFKKAATSLYNTFVRAESWLAFNNPVMMFVIYGSIIALSWFAAHFIADGTMTTGNLTSMFSYVMSMMMALMMLSMIFVMISMSTASAKRIAEVLNEKADITNPDAPVMQVPDGRIDFNHVDFVYKKDSETDTLKDIDIHINAGETIGIIGGTGCGKSSFVNLISRLYDVKNGSVCVGGVDVRKYDIETLRDEVSVVLQKNVLFSGTILDNLRWGDENATEEECIEACRQACADEFIERMPDKYNTWIEQGGTNVSGGQRQRLCIARALLKKPKVLILDDSTSAVDTATDAKIKHAFATKIPGTTKLIVSQRISSIQDADRILVLDNGMVSGFDTHEHLVENNKVYREIYEVQTQGGGDFDEQAEEAKENQPVDANAKAADDKKGGADNE
jgi:ATP-binding cassette subfamily B multidrug efflux pump